MKVSNLEVHIKLNHKRKKSSMSFISSDSPLQKTRERLPSITKYQKMSKLEGENKKGYQEKKQDNGNEQPGPTLVTTERLQSNLETLGNLMNEETMKKGWNENTKNDIKVLLKSGTISKKQFEMNLKRLGVNRIGNKYVKKTDEKNSRCCPDCGIIFGARGKHRGKNLEYLEHIKNCGLGSSHSEALYIKPVNLSNDEATIQTRTEIKPIPNSVIKPEPLLYEETIHEKICMQESTCSHKKSSSPHEALKSEDSLLSMKVKTEPCDNYSEDNDDQAKVKMKTGVEEEQDQVLEIDLKTELNEFKLEPKVVLDENDENIEDSETATKQINFIFPLTQSENEAHIESIGETWLKSIRQAEKNKNDGNGQKKNRESIGDAWFRKISEIETKSEEGGKC